MGVFNWLKGYLSSLMSGCVVLSSVLSVGGLVSHFLFLKQEWQDFNTSSSGQNIYKKSVVLLSYQNTFTLFFKTWELQTVVSWATSLFLMSRK